MTLFAAFMAVAAIFNPAAQAGQIPLSWGAPSTNVDGTPLTDLAGYKIYYGSAPGSYQQSVKIGNVTSYTLGSLTDNATYYLAVTAVDSTGYESPHSLEIRRTATATALPQSSYTITASAGSGGSITPSGTSTVTTGGSKSYSISAIAGYSIADVTVDGVSVGPVSSYAFSNVTANHTIAARFASGVFTITTTAGTGGTISPAGSVIIGYGASQTFTITPATGYINAGVKVDGVSVGAVNSYTFTAVKANHTIAASFAASTTGTGSTGTTAQWSYSTTTKSSGYDGNASYLLAAPIKAGKSGTVTKLLFSVRLFGSPTPVRVALYDSSRRKLTQAIGTVSSAGNQSFTVPAVPVTANATYYVAIQAASNLLYKFDCGATSGGVEASNSYANGLPATLPAGWSGPLPYLGMLVQ